MKRIIALIFILLVVGIGITFFIIDQNQEPLNLNEEIKQETGGKYIRLSKGFVHYELKGESHKPLLILIGGAGLGYDIWDNNVHHFLKSGFQVLRYDHYGRGYSDKVNEKYSLDLYSNQFTELLDSLKITSPVNLAGVSMGAMVAMQFTVLNPEKVLKLVLIDPAGINPFQAPFVLKTPIVSDLLMTFYWRPKAVRSQMEEFFEPQRFPEYKQELERQIRIEGYKQVQKSIWLNTLSVDMSNYVKQLGKLNKEILLVWGKQDTRTLIETSNTFIELIPEITFLAVDKAGHLSNYERPEIINPAIVRFLKR